MGIPSLGLERLWSQVEIARPVYLSDADGSLPEGGTVFVSQDGYILFASGAGAVSTFLDIRDRVNRGGTEEGLLGLAFHPGFATSGRFFVYYSAGSPRRSVLSEFTVGLDGMGDPGSERVVLEIAEPYPNHNGGMVEFGPDGFLYVGVGDGGSAGDPTGNGQDTGTLLGKLLRIDVDPHAAGAGYAPPPDNPFAGGGGRPEVWAYGLRNPWRFSFDRETGDLWVGDVGQNAIEEIDLITRGGNYGWSVMEGEQCYRPASGCRRDGLLPPVAYYSHGLGCSVTGGYVYRGDRVPGLYGVYLYADYCSGRVWGLRWDGERVTEQSLIVDTALNISSFSEGEDGEVYIIDLGGDFYRFLTG